MFPHGIHKQGAMLLAIINIFTHRIGGDGKRNSGITTLSTEKKLNTGKGDDSGRIMKLRLGGGAGLVGYGDLNELCSFLMNIASIARGILDQYS